MSKHTGSPCLGQASGHQAEVLSQLCYTFVRPVLCRLHEHLDRRLVHTLLDLLVVIVMHRHRQQGLVLSELGGYLLGEAQAPAGTKRISALLKSPRWTAQTIETYLWEKGEAAVARLQALSEAIYVIWDESVIEKPESLKAERLGPVRSSKARRLQRIKPGYYTPPSGRPVFVPGWNWLHVLVTGARGTSTLAHLRWWTTRGEAASDKRTEERQVLQQVAQRWGRQVVHVWDRGFAGAPWVAQALQAQVRFILRWQKGYNLQTADGQVRKAWECTRGKRSVDHRLIHDSRRRCDRQTGLLYLPVRVPELAVPLWLVVARPGQRHTPWYLLTNEPLTCVADAWQVVFAYSRRWQVEMSIRYSKTELAVECPRLRSWAALTKLWSSVALVQAFLFWLLDDRFAPLRTWLLQQWCARYEKRSRETPAPLYRLRLALSQLWLAHRPSTLPRLNPG
jgi:Transposase DDE domain